MGVVVGVSVHFRDCPQVQQGTREKGMAVSVGTLLGINSRVKLVGTWDQDSKRSTWTIRLSWVVSEGCNIGQVKMIGTGNPDSKPILGVTYLNVLIGSIRSLRSGDAFVLPTVGLTMNLDHSRMG